jgi:alpha-galactosidase
MRIPSRFLVPIALVGISASIHTNAAPTASGTAEFHGAYARWSPEEVVVGNRHFERKWKVDQGLLTATSLRDLDAGIEWIARPANAPAPHPAGEPAKRDRELLGTTSTGKQNAVEEASLVLKLASDDGDVFSYRFQIFPSARGVGITFSSAVDGQGATAEETDVPTGIEVDPSIATVVSASDALEDLMLSPHHIRFTQVLLKDQTDYHNQLVFENSWLSTPSEGRLSLPGNVFYAEDPLTKAGLIFVKFAPLPHARPVKSDWDAQFIGGPRRLRFAGQGYPFVLLSYSGGRVGMIEALQSYQRQLRAYNPDRDAMFLSNTWGDRSRDARINEAFMLREVEAGARLGVDIIQIDDGWQKGMTANSARGRGVWNDYWATDPDFWNPNPDGFPNGLEKVVSAAREKGMKFGLWYGPDSIREAANWERDADRILELHRQHGIDYFKLDSMKVETPATGHNLQRFFDKVMEDSQGRVVFDLDVTAEIRPGYFGAPGAGPIFVENRYTDFRNYWPHHTLRNLWALAHFVDPLRLRMEFLNNTRSQERYEGDPLAPIRYRPDTLFATVMYANPLGWFEVSNLPEEYVAQASALVDVWKRERPALFSGTILPIGDAPDGASWTGLASIAQDRKSARILVFRELNDASKWTTPLPLIHTEKLKITTLAGRGTATINGTDLKIEIPEPLDFLWIKLESE